MANIASYGRDAVLSGISYVTKATASFLLTGSALHGALTADPDNGPIGKDVSYFMTGLTNRVHSSFDAANAANPGTYIPADYEAWEAGLDLTGDVATRGIESIIATGEHAKNLFEGITTYQPAANAGLGDIAGDFLAGPLLYSLDVMKDIVVDGTFTAVTEPLEFVGGVALALTIGVGFYTIPFGWAMDQLKSQGLVSKGVGKVKDSFKNPGGGNSMYDLGIPGLTAPGKLDFSLKKPANDDAPRQPMYGT